jgi:hypothetical protein
MADNAKTGKRKFTAAEIIERKKSLAGERNTRVLWADVPDTHRLFDMASALNRGVKLLRHNLGFRVSFEEGVSHLMKLKELEMQMDRVVKDICGSVGVPYRTPASLKKEIEITSVGDVEGSIAEKNIENKMEMAYANFPDDGSEMLTKKKKS